MISCVMRSALFLMPFLLVSGHLAAITWRKPLVKPPVEAAPPGEAPAIDHEKDKDLDHAFDQLSRHNHKDGRYYAGYGLNPTPTLGATNNKTEDYQPLGWFSKGLTAIDHSSLRVMADYATVNPASGTFSYVGHGSQTGLVSLVPAIKREHDSFAVGMGYHYASFYDELAPRFAGGNSWHAIINRHDFTLFGEYEYACPNRITLFSSLGASLQRRVLIFYSDHDYSADDYYANFTLGYEGTLGAEWRVSLWEREFFARAFWRYMSGGKMATENLNYDNNRVNVNFAAYATGIAAGYTF